MLTMKDKQINVRTTLDTKLAFFAAVKSVYPTVRNLTKGETKPGQCLEWFAAWFTSLSQEGRIDFIKKCKAAYAASDGASVPEQGVEEVTEPQDDTAIPGKRGVVVSGPVGESDGKDKVAKGLAKPKRGR